MTHTAVMSYDFYGPNSFSAQMERWERYKKCAFEQSCSQTHDFLVKAGLRDPDKVYLPQDLLDDIHNAELCRAEDLSGRVRELLAVLDDCDEPRRSEIAALCAASQSAICEIVKRVAIERGNDEALRIIARARPAPLSNAGRGGPMPSEIVWMPAGIHTISAGMVGGGSIEATVVCDEDAYNAVAASFEAMKTAGDRVWLDLNHEDGAASADVRSFSWDPSRGIIAQLEWTPLGEWALRGRRYTSFSPTFEVNKKSGKVLGLLRGMAAGGLVNAPAFSDAMPLLTS